MFGFQLLANALPSHFIMEKHSKNISIYINKILRTTPFKDDELSLPVYGINNRTNPETSLPPISYPNMVDLS